MRALFAASLVAASIFSGCSKEREVASAIPEGANRYTVRGIVVRMPGASVGAASRSVFIHHEPIPQFKNWEGAAVGMGEMTMEFPLAPAVSLEGIQVGDAVEADFAVWFSGRAGSWVTTRLVELPASTPLNLQDPPERRDDARP